MFLPYASSPFAYILVKVSLSDQAFYLVFQDNALLNHMVLSVVVIISLALICVRWYLFLGRFGRELNNQRVVNFSKNCYAIGI